MRTPRLLLLLWLGVAAVVPLGGCSSWFRTDVEIPKEQAREVPVACIKPGKRPQRPALYTLDELMAMDPYRRTIAAWLNLKRYETYVAEQEAVIDGCARIPPAPP